MKTLRRFIEEDDMDFDEAAESAVAKRKFLLNRLMTENSQLRFWKGKSYLSSLEMDRKAPINSRPNFRLNDRTDKKIL